MEDLEQAMAFANYQSTLTQQKTIAAQRFADKCVVAQDGGLFLVTLSFLSSIKIITDPAQWIVDMNNNPIWIADINSFYQLAYNAYHTALAEYGETYSQLKKQRSVKSLVGQ